MEGPLWVPGEPYGQEKEGLRQVYFMMYGEVYDSDRWVTLVVMTLYLFAVNIIIFNFLIVGFNNIY